MKTFSVILFLCGLTMLLSCNQGKNIKYLFELEKNTGIVFNNTVHDNDSINILNYRNFYNGGGVAAGDINNDGYADIFFTANQGSNKLFLNKGNLKFEDISTQSGFKNKPQFSTGVVMADINADGWLDIFVCNAGNMQNAALRSNQLFINNHNLTFTESAVAYGLQDSGYTTQVSFFDYDLDGDLDMFKIDNSPVPVNSLGYPKQRDISADKWTVPDYLKGGGDHLYKNEQGHFTEVTRQAGIHGTLMSFGLGVTVGDINGDNYPDIYVSNDFFERDYLYINQKNGTFKDELEQRMQHNSYASMGADLGDINNDGAPEIFTTDMLPADDYRLKTTLSFDDIDQFRLKERNGFFHQFLQNTLQLNDGSGNFKDIANYSGVNASEWSWGALIFDADNDRLNDLYVCNGIYRDLTNQDFLSFDANEIKEKMMQTGEKKLADLVERIPSIAVPNKMFRNMGNLKFSDEGLNWGFTQNSFSNGAVYADLDNDGDLDIIVNNTNEPAFIYRNNSREQTNNNFTGITVKGKGNNTFAIGTKIIVYAANTVLTREVMPSRGFQSSVDYKQTIGLGDASHIDSIMIIWPDLTFTKIMQPPVNKYLVYAQPLNALPLPQIVKDTQRPVFEKLIASFDKHVDDDYTDFYMERGIPEMLSHAGPKADTADVNGDGLTDIYIGGTIKNAGQLYLQNTSGNFIKKEVKSFDQYKGFVDGAVLFFDCDSDGDKDLLLCSAGNAAMPNSRELQHRLFINNGKAEFVISPASFPSNKDNISVAVADDFDKDGDLDLFIGAGSVTGSYGVTPQSHIYKNNGKGIFSDMAPDKCNGIINAGMLTGAVWVDIDNDKSNELVMVGRWMAPKIFKFENNAFVSVSTNLSEIYGWWQTVAATDIDGDGKKDLILGNLGQNFYLKPDSSHPVKLFLYDFDNNGQLDKIVTRTVNGIDKPVFMKGELESQLPMLKKQNLHNTEYASKSIDELFERSKIEAAEIKKINYASSCIAFNRGNKGFEIKELPVAVQLSSVNKIVSCDVNFDGNTDLIITGNEFGFQPQLGRLDANAVLVLMNNGKGNLTVLSEKESGISLKGQVRDALVIKQHTAYRFLFLANDEIPEMFKVNSKKK